MTANDPYAAQLTALRRYRASAERYLSALAKSVGLHATDVSALNHLIDAANLGEAVSPGELGQMLALSGPATTAVIDRLERAGYVTRRPSASDGRRVEIELTAEVSTDPGTSPLASFGEILRSALADFTPAQREVFEVMTTTLANRLDTDARDLESRPR